MVCQRWNKKSSGCKIELEYEVIIKYKRDKRKGKNQGIIVINSRSISNMQLFYFSKNLRTLNISIVYKASGY